MSTQLLQLLSGKEQDKRKKKFVQSFHQYLNHNAKKDFVIDLDNVYVWLGFAQKAHAVAALDFLVQDIHYKIVVCSSSKASKEQVLLTVNGFKQLCIAANTDKARRVREYYIAMEGVMLEHKHQMMDDQRAIAEATSKKVWG